MPLWLVSCHNRIDEGKWHHSALSCRHHFRRSSLSIQREHRKPFLPPLRVAQSGALSCRIILHHCRSAIAVAIKCEPSVIRADSSPCKRTSDALLFEIEVHNLVRICEAKSVAQHIYQDRATVAVPELISSTTLRSRIRTTAVTTPALTATGPLPPGGGQGVVLLSCPEEDCMGTRFLSKV